MSFEGTKTLARGIQQLMHVTKTAAQGTKPRATQALASKTFRNQILNLRAYRPRGIKQWKNGVVVTTVERVDYKASDDDAVHNLS